jgi:Flp pilus assembly protein TadD
MRIRSMRSFRSAGSARGHVRGVIGQTLFEQGRFDEAVVQLRAYLDRTAVSGSNAEADARVVAALSLGKLGRSGEARDLLL